MKCFIPTKNAVMFRNLTCDQPHLVSYELHCEMAVMSCMVTQCIQIHFISVRPFYLGRCILIKVFVSTNCLVCESNTDFLERRREKYIYIYIYIAARGYINTVF